jgi:protein-tyrosine phosphatase
MKDDAFGPHILEEGEYLRKIRDGVVLNRSMLLKADHFKVQIKRPLKHHIIGAPNFRKIPHNIYGTSQPTYEGLLTILTLLNVQSTKFDNSSNDRNGLPTCYWCSMREEPMIYIQGRTFVLRELESPMNNIKALAGIDGTRLEQMEERLKQDIIKETEKNQDIILVHSEVDDQLVACWIKASSIQTPREVYELLSQAGFRLKYYRLPISAGYGPEDRYFDAIMTITKKAQMFDPLVFNCQLGRGRSKFFQSKEKLIKELHFLF